MRTTLLDHPDKAAVVAAGIAAMSDIEIHLPAAFANAVGMSQQAAMAILMQFRNVSDRLDVMRDVLSSMEAKHAAASILEDLIVPIREVNAFRNELAHGLYAEGVDGQLELITWVFAKNRKPENIALTDKLLSEHLIRATVIKAHLGHIIARPLEPLPDNMPPIPPAVRQKGGTGKASRSGKQPPPQA